MMLFYIIIRKFLPYENYPLCGINNRVAVSVIMHIKVCCIIDIINFYKWIEIIAIDFRKIIRCDKKN